MLAVYSVPWNYRRMAETPIRHIRMPDELWDALERIGKEAGVERPAGWLVRKACEEYIDRHRAAKRAAKAASE
jgi:predicted DNA-binding protein